MARQINATNSPLTKILRLVFMCEEYNRIMGSVGHESSRASFDHKPVGDNSLLAFETSRLGLTQSIIKLLQYSCAKLRRKNWTCRHLLARISLSQAAVATSVPTRLFCFYRAITTLQLSTTLSTLPRSLCNVWPRLLV